MDGATILLSALVLLTGYLLGSFSGAIIASKLFHHTDIRKYGSGNAGMTNALRTFGGKTAFWVTLIDALKTFAALIIGSWILNDHAIPIAATGVLLGHAFPLYHRFKGGTCVLSAACIVLYTDWRIFLIVAAVFFVVAYLSKIVALGSMAGAISAAVATPFLHKGSTVLIIFNISMALFIIILHRSNIKRIIQKSEFKATKGGR